MNYTHSVFAVALLLLVGGCASQSITTADVSRPVSWGSADNVMQLRHLYFSGQPDESQLDAAANAGVRLVINLRESGELDGSEQALVESRGMRYYNVPIKRKAPLDPQALAEIEGILQANAGQPALLHCRSGSRAGMFLATHLVSKHNLPIDDAIEVAEKAGMKVGEPKVRDYLSGQ